MQTTPPEQAGGAVQGYSRADVDQYLRAATAEKQRLDAAVAAAHERRRRAEDAAMLSGASADLVRDALGGLRLELGARRGEVERQVEALVARSHEQAAAMLRDARSRAHAILESRAEAPAPATPAPASPAPDPVPVVPPVAAATPSAFESALSTLTVEEPEPVPDESEIDLRLEDAFWQPPSTGLFPGNGQAPNGQTGVNGHARNGSANGHDADGELRATTGFATLLRRALPNRPTDPTEAAEDDAFFDFLRGALDDSEPLGPRGDEESQP